MLIKSAHVPTPVKKLVYRRGTVSHVENYDPLSSENLKRPEECQGKIPKELLVASRLCNSAWRGHAGGCEVRGVDLGCEGDQHEEKVTEISTD